MNHLPFDMRGNEMGKTDAMTEFSENIIKSIEKLNGESFPWVKPWTTIDTHFRNAFTNRNYRGLYNILTCSVNDFSDPRYVTFAQVRKAGGKVIAGSKATRLLAWNFIKKTDTEGKEKTIPFSKIHCVFNVEQVEGIEFPEIDKDVFNDSLKENEIIVKLFDDLGVSCKKIKSNSAGYTPSTDVISIPDVRQFDKTESWAGTCLHELIHWTAKRVNHEVKGYSSDIDVRAHEELVAEIGSMFLCMRLNIDGYMDKNNLVYIENWKKQSKESNGNKLIYKACKLAEERCNYIMKNSYVFQEENSEESIEEMVA